MMVENEGMSGQSRGKAIRLKIGSRTGGREQADEADRWLYV